MDHLPRHTIPCPPFMHQYTVIAESDAAHTNQQRHIIRLHRCKVCGARKATATGKDAYSHEYVSFAKQLWEQYGLNLFENG